MRNKLNIENKDHDAGHFFSLHTSKTIILHSSELCRDNSNVFLTWYLGNCTSVSNTPGNLQPFIKSTVSLVKHLVNRWVSPFHPGNSQFNCLPYRQSAALICIMCFNKMSEWKVTVWALLMRSRYHHSHFQTECVCACENIYPVLVFLHVTHVHQMVTHRPLR